MINFYDGKTGICRKCFIDTGMQKELNNQPDLIEKRRIAATGKTRSEEFKLKQSENMKKYYKEHPERRKRQGEIFRKAWKDGRHIEPCNFVSNSHSKPEKMMYQALCNVFHSSNVSKSFYMSKDSNRKVYPDAVLYGKIAFEFNGDYFHGNPDIYGPDDIVSIDWKAKDIREHDAERLRYMIEDCEISRNIGDYEQVYESDLSFVIIIWENEVKDLKTQEDWNNFIANRYLGYDEYLSV